MIRKINAPTGHCERYSKNTPQSNNSRAHNQSYIDFERLKDRARPYALAILQRALPGGKLVGHEYVTLNPRRSDKRLGSFKFNINNHKWQDFATGDKGGDIISLWAYVKGIRQIDAAREIQYIVGGV